MIEVTERETIACEPRDWLEFVLDVERYAEVDDKIGPIRWSRRRGDVVEFKFRPRLPGVRLPEPCTTSRMRLVAGERIDVRLAPLPRNALNRCAGLFRARFSAVAVDGGAEVTRMISFRFNPLLRGLFEPTLRRTLPASVRRELALAKRILEDRR
ncbi:SRPBCC family protein [Saccharothrix sp. NPDC042600]|uniref:SRPBCC family protein n=1 Tax=Saccharothrix TaxID=2071 RepID=UPI00340F41E7|nr:hypothetical protein GCM10017745_58240 [Saccharothrix mutabilis subsp. capreolus]